MQPSPWLDIFQAVVANDTFTQIFECDVVVASVVFNFSLEHHGANSEDVTSPIVEKASVMWDALQALIEAVALKVGALGVFERGLGYPSGVVVHGGRDEI